MTDRMRDRHKAKGPAPGRCGQCRHFDNRPQSVEQAFPGLNILSSAYGSTRGDSGLCRLHGRFLLPQHTCRDFAPRKTEKAQPGTERS